MIINVLPGKARVHVGLNQGYLDCSSHRFPGCAMAQVVSRSLSVWRYGFDPWPFHVGVLMDRVTLGQVFILST